MKKLLGAFWRDDLGAVIASEFVFILTTLGIGTAVGLASVRDAVNNELSELSNSILSVSQGYYLSGQIGCCTITDGSEAIDRPVHVDDPRCTPPPRWSVTDQLACH